MAKGLSRLVGMVGLAAMTAFSPINSLGSGSGFSLDDGKKREIIYAVDDFYAGRPEGKHRQGVLDDNQDASVLFKTTAFSPVDLRMMSDEVYVGVEPSVEDRRCTFEYYNQSGKRENAAGTHAYVFHPRGSRVYIAGQELLDSAGNSLGAVVPGESTPEYRAAEAIGEIMGGGLDFSENSILKGEEVAQDLDFSNAYTKILDKLPGRAGKASSVLGKATELIMKGGESQRFEKIRKRMGGNYSISKLEFYTNSVFDRYIPFAGRRIHLGFEGSSGESCFLAVPSLDFSGNVGQDKRRATLNDLIFGFQMGESASNRLGESYGLFSGTRWEHKWRGDARGTDVDYSLYFDPEGFAVFESVVRRSSRFERSMGTKEGDFGRSRLNIKDIKEEEGSYRFVISDAILNNNGDIEICEGDDLDFEVAPGRHEIRFKILRNNKSRKFNRVWGDKDSP